MLSYLSSDLVMLIRHDVWILAVSLRYPRALGMSFGFAGVTLAR